MTNLRDCDLTPYEDVRPAIGSRDAASRERSAPSDGLRLYELEPGRRRGRTTSISAREEWLFVIEGELTLRTPEGDQSLRAGDVVSFPEGPEGAHAVRNDSDATARFAMPSVDQPTNAADYPDTGTFVLHGPGFEHRAKLGDPVEYWET